MSANKRKQSTSAKSGIYVTSTPSDSPFAGDDEFDRVLKTARYNASMVSQLGKDRRANQGRIRHHQEDTLTAIRDFANQRSVPPEQVADQLTRAMLA